MLHVVLYINEANICQENNLVVKDTERNKDNNSIFLTSKVEKK